MDTKTCVERFRSELKRLEPRCVVSEPRKNSNGTLVVDVTTPWRNAKVGVNGLMDAHLADVGIGKARDKEPDGVLFRREAVGILASCKGVGIDDIDSFVSDLMEARAVEKLEILADAGQKVQDKVTRVPKELADVGPIESKPPRKA